MEITSYDVFQSITIYNRDLRYPAGAMALWVTQLIFGLKNNAHRPHKTHACLGRYQRLKIPALSYKNPDTNSQVGVRQRRPAFHWVTLHHQHQFAPAAAQCRRIAWARRLAPGLPCRRCRSNWCWWWQCTHVKKRADAADTDLVIGIGIFYDNTGI